MDQMERMRARHSVRNYLNQPIEEEKRAALQAAIDRVNRDAGLHVQLFTEEPEAFDANAPHYGQFKGCRNYFAMVGPKDADEAIGYYGEQLVLLAQELGLNTCWVALTFKKGKVKVDADKGEKLHVVIALGYGADQGRAHKSKDATELSNLSDASPAWFRRGMEAALLAPTAVNQQKFYFEQKGDRVRARTKLTFYGKMDLGIAKYHFELGAGKENFTWED
ncbi:MAG: nitroreductase [Oscillospiraceae bacterium]|nr:nitroreductase [Oscillospiraceae bacterium]